MRAEGTGECSEELTLIVGRAGQAGDRDMFNVSPTQQR